jgi:rhodanese-related sulfurtransferase
MDRRNLRAGLILPALAAAALTLASCGGSEAVTTVSGDSVAEAVSEPGVTVIDVRTPEEYAAGHVEGALNIDVQNPGFDAAIAQLPSEEPYVVYCRSGNRSAAAAEEMADAGFTDITDVGGLDDLAAAGVPLVA